MKMIRTLWAALAVALLAPSLGYAQCNAQFLPGQICGNPTGSQAPPVGVSSSVFQDSLYGTMAGTIIYRGPSGWTSLPGNTSGTSVLQENSSGVPSWVAAAGTGTVTSVGLSLPGIFTVSGSPVTTTGTLTGTLASQSQNLFFASPNGSSGAPTFRAMVSADLPTIGTNSVLGNATAGTAQAIALSVPSCSAASSALTWTTNSGFGCNTITGTGSVTSVATGTGLTGGPITTTGTISLAAIAADNVLANSTGGSAAPIATAIGSCSAAQNALTYNTSTHAFGCNTISGSGTVLSGTAGNLTWYSGSTNVVGPTSNANLGSGGTAGTLTLGTANTTLGSVVMEGSTSGAVILTPQAAAGTPTITFGTASGTPAVTASAPLAIASSTGNITVTGVAGAVLGGSGPAFTATPTLGAMGVATGQLKLAGTTSGTVTITTQDAAGTWTMKFPTSPGSSGQFLETDGVDTASWASPTGSGTVNAGTSGQMAYYASSSAAVSGNANANISGGSLTLGTASSTQGRVILEGSGGGALTITTQGTAGTPTWTAGTASGTPVVTASAPLAITTATGNLVITGAAGQVLAGATPAFTATPTLGASGTPGSLTLGNATSGLLTLQTVTGALGTVTVSLPAATDTLVGKATTDTLTNKTYNTAGTGNVFQVSGTTVTGLTGSGGSLVMATSPTLVTPTLGVATATTINKVTLTAPATGSTLTIADGKTLTVSNSITLAGTDATTWTGASTNMTIAALNIADQTVTGGANVTSDNLGTITTNITLDCGARPLQYLTNNVTTSWAITAPTNDGSCIVLVTNNSTGTLVAPTFTNFSVGSNTGDTYAVTNSNKYSLFVWRVNGVAGYRWAAHQ